MSWKSDNDISGDGGVMKYVLSEGSGWETPNNIDKITGLCLAESHNTNQM